MAMFFYIFAALVLISSVLVVTSRNPVYSVLWLIFAFCNSAGLMILLGAEFLAMMLIVIYVGAVAVLFLFIVMMLDTNITEKLGFRFNKSASLALAVFLLIDLLLIIFLSVGSKINIANSEFAIPQNVNNVTAIGKVLYTDFILPFQTAGIILFVAMIASISLTIRKRNSYYRRQNPKEQLARNKDRGLAIVKMQSKQGVSGIDYDK